MKLPPKRSECCGGSEVREKSDREESVGPCASISISPIRFVANVYIRKAWYLPENPTGINSIPALFKNPMRYLSGVKIQPPKKPFRNLAKISSFERSPMSFEIFLDQVR